MNSSQPAGAFISPQAVAHHCRLLGKDPASVRVRGFAHKDNPRKAHIGARKRVGINLAELELWQKAGRGVYLVVNDGGDTKASITHCKAVWAEWDDRPIEWQLTAWRELGLPEPSFIVVTGGRSAHLYWLLSEPIPVQEWEPLEAALLAHAGADPAVKDPSRVLRLAGCSYIGADGLPHGRVEIVHESGRTYTAEQIAAALPQQPLTPPLVAVETERRPIVLEDPPVADLPPRSMAEVRRALSLIPRRFSGSYEFHRNVLWGLIDAVSEAGGTLDDAIALMESHCPSNSNGWNIPQVARSGNGSVRAATFWFAASEHGYDLKPTQPAAKASAPGPGFTKRPGTQARWGKVKLGLQRRLSHFHQCIRALVATERNSLRRIARVRHAHAALELKTAINQKEIGQLILEQIDERTGNRFAALSAADRQAMPIPNVEWEVPDCIPRRDLTIIGGRAKVGKTRLANALVASLLKQQDFLGFGEPPPGRRVILVTDDQGDGDTAQMLQQLGIWDHPDLLWSRRFRVTERNVDLLLEAIAANPGAVVILDSLRSITRSTAFGENDPEMGSLIYDLKEQIVDAGGTLILIHHCNKSNDATGTEALSGHNAIAGAANTIITLHYMAKGQRLAKDSPDRRLVREARSGPPADLVVALAAESGEFSRIGDYEAITAEDDEKAAAATNAEDVIRKETAEVKEALRFLEGLHRRGDDVRPGLLDLCKSLGIAPPDAQRKADLDGPVLNRYRQIGRALSRLDGVVLAEKCPTKGSGYFLTYRLTDEGADLVAAIFGL
jgi:hypothetical protein